MNMRIEIIVALGEVIEGFHKQKEDGELREGISLKFVRNVEPISWSQIYEIEELEGCAPIRNRAQGSLFELTKYEFETIMALEEVPEEKETIKIPEVDFNRDLTIDSLYFPPEEKSKLIKQIQINLRRGKHIILTGPPGTGKSKLASIICETYRDDNYTMVTATSDWSTFNTIDGYRPDRENQLNFDPGVFLACFKNSNNNHPANKWLILDEINRADIDKAFGSLFSALTVNRWKGKNGARTVMKYEICWKIRFSARKRRVFCLNFSGLLRFFPVTWNRVWLLNLSYWKRVRMWWLAGSVKGENIPSIMIVMDQRS